MFQIYLLKWYTTTLLNTGMETSHFYSHDIDQDKKKQTNKKINISMLKMHTFAFVSIN